MASAKKLERPPREVKDLAQELWGMGWTVVRRHRDPFHVDPKIVPEGMTYEWRAKTVYGESTQQAIKGMTEGGWHFVPSSRHDGIFMPLGYNDIIDVGGQVLMERPREYADAVHAERISKAHKNVDDWVERNAGAGFSGGVRVWTGDHNAPPPQNFHKVGDDAIAAKVIEMTPRATLAPSPPVQTFAPVAQAMPQIMPRHPLLRWLFNLISVEK